jgi:undecaprenyl-diphosphatase
MIATLDPVQAAILGAVQGLTEFLPISSSAHLYALPTLFGWPYAGLAFDVALHWGTLIALLVAFGRDWWNLAADLLGRDAARRAAALDLTAKLVAGSVPAAIAGLLLKDLAETHLRALPLQAVMLIVFGAALWAADRFSRKGDKVTTPGWATCLAMGAAQAVALVPGVSRSGITMTAGRLSGLDRVSAARFSFLLATPITFGAGLLEMRDLPRDLPLATLAIGVAVSAVTGLLAIRGLLLWLGRAGFAWFFAYRVVFAIILLIRFRPA